MSDLRPTPHKIKLGGEEFGLLFSINVIDEIQDHFNISISELTNVLKDQRTIFKNLKYILTLLINEGIDDEESGHPHVDEKWVGRKITANNLQGLTKDILLAFSEGTPKSEGDEIPNGMSE